MLLRLCTLILACGLLLARPAAASISVLVYHRFDPTTPASTTVTTAVFEEQLAWLSAHHFQFVKLQSVVDVLTHRAPAFTGPTVALCADDGHLSVYTQMFPIIQREHIPVTLFIYPSAISNASYAMTWDQLREMEHSGLVEVQSHTYWHPNFNHERKRLDADAYQHFVDWQLTRSKRTLEQKMNHSIDLLAWPFGIHDPDLEAAAARAGYRAAFALDGRPLHADEDIYAIPRHMMEQADRGTRLADIVGQGR